MDRANIEKLARMARIELQEDEADILAENITSILNYVSEISEITGDKEVEKKAGPLHNVFREDGKPHAPGIYTDDLLKAAPNREGMYIKVKKILEDKK